MKLTLGSYIAGLRKEKGLTQRELAEILSVSDKTVSHWECDKTSPDISLLPIIADIFGITVDELLRGEKEEKKNTTEKESEETDGYTEEESGNTGILYAMDIAFNKFRTKNFISVALSVIAIICGFIVNYIKSTDIGYLVFIAVLTVPFLLTVLFRGNFSSRLISPYIDKAILRDYEKKANRITLCNLYFSFLCFILYSGRMLLFYTADIILCLLIFLISGAVIYLCEKILRKKDLVSHSDKPLTIKKTALLKIFCCFICTILILMVFGSHDSLDEAAMVHEKAEYSVIAEADFADYMEKKVPAPDDIYGREDGRWDLYTELYPHNKGDEYSFSPDFGHYDNTAIEILNPDEDGEITFIYNNLEIGRFSYNAEEGFRVYTHSQLIKAREEAEKEYGMMFIIHLVLYPVAILASVSFYFILKRLFIKKCKNKTLSLKLF